MSTHADELFRTNSQALATDLPPCRFRPKSGWDPLRFLLVQRFDLNWNDFGMDFWCMSWRGVSGAQMRKVEDTLLGTNITLCTECTKMDVWRWETAWCHFGSSPWHPCLPFFSNQHWVWRRDLRAGVAKRIGGGDVGGVIQANPSRMTKASTGGELGQIATKEKWWRCRNPEPHHPQALVVG